MSTALVTGGTGFIGSHLVRRLVGDGVAVHLLCRQDSNFRRLTDVLSRVTTHVADLTDRAALREIARAVAPDRVFHLAAAPLVAGTAACAADLITTNVLGTINLVDACGAVDYGAFVNTGDSLEYGPTAEPMRESACCRPATLHGIAKLSGTLYAQSVATTERRPIVTLRLFSAFGPQDDASRLIPRLIAGAFEGGPVSVSRPEIARDFLYVEDLVELYLEVSRRPVAGDIFNAGSGHQTTIGELVTAVERLSGTTLTVRWNEFPAAEYDTTRWVADMSRTLDAYAWRPRTSLVDGLRRTAASMTGRP